MILEKPKKKINTKLIYYINIDCTRVKHGK